MKSETKTGIYRGKIMHHRFSPKRHHFTYPLFIFAIDLDEIEKWSKKLRLFSHNGRSLYTLRDRDHLGTPDRTPKENVIQLLRDRGYSGTVDQIVMITQFRVLGYLFNPVSFYYCYSQGVEVAYVAEVGNTFHQKHSYVFFGGGNSHWVEKVFYVSPFLEMDLVYNFRFEPLGELLEVHVDDYKGKEPVLKTFIKGKYQPLSDWSLFKTFLKIPLMSVWIISWIHWQALKLWLKKIPLVFRPLDGMKPGWAQTQDNP